MLKCGICGRELKMLNWLHIRSHNITWQEYRRMFPDARVMSDEVIEKQSLRMMGNTLQKGVPRTEETKHKMSESHKGKSHPNTHIYTEEERRKVSERFKGHKFLVGRKLTEEHKRKISIGCKGNKSNTGRKLPKSHKLAISEGLARIKEQRSESMKEALDNPETRRRMRESRRKWLDSNGGKIPEEQRRNATAALKKRSKDPEYRKKLSEGKKKLWQRPEYRRNCVAAVMKAMAIRPNKPEQRLASLLGLLWQYTGDGGLIIDGKCPDFWNGDHKLIEMFGDYWHRGENPQERIDFFAQHGYKCLVIWEHELEDMEAVRRRVDEFSSVV